MSRKDDDVVVARERIGHMLDAIEAIRTFMEGRAKDEFVASDFVISAVMTKFIITGEAANRIPRSIEAAYPAVPWRDAARFRNFLVHVYDMVEPIYLWKTIQEELPGLETELRRTLRELSA